MTEPSMPSPVTVTRDFSLSHRYCYSASQLDAYFDRIQLPQKERSSPIAASHDASQVDAAEQLRFLTVLVRHNLANIPFENLDLHYSAHRSISIDPAHLFEKIVTRGVDLLDSKTSVPSNVSNGADGAGSAKAGSASSPSISGHTAASRNVTSTGAHRGGYCMENNALLGTVLRSLKYKVASVGARVNEAVQPMTANKNWEGPKFDGWNHMINVVKIPTASSAEGCDSYIVDVGFGSSGPTRPLPLRTNQIWPNVGQQSMRLVLGPVAQHTDETQSLWQYEHRDTPDGPWIPTYCFSLTEFFPEDFAIINYFVSTHRTSWFTWYVVCVRMIMENGEIVGDLTMFERDVKRRIQGKSESIALLESEQHRIEILEKAFQIRLTEAEKMGIRGLRSELL